MMINNKKCNLIVLLVLVALPRSSKSIFPRLTKRSTDDGACEQSTAKFCSEIINDKNGLIQRFGPDTSRQIQNHYKNATVNCKVLLCVMTMYAVVVEGEKHFPNSPFTINDEAFVNVIKGSGLVECNDNKDNNYSTISGSRTEDVHTTTTTVVDDKSYTTDGSGNIIDFYHFETNSTQQDAQSIKSNEIDGSVNESKHEPRKGIIDILYTNENYTNAAKSQYVNEQSDTELYENSHGIGTESVVNLDNLVTETISYSTPPFIYNYGDDERAELDVANRIETTTAANENTISTTDFVFVTSFATSTFNPIISTDMQVDGVATKSGSYVSNSGSTVDETKRVLTLDTSAMPSKNQSALSQVGNVIFQLLGEEGYNSFSCNLTTDTDDDDHPTDYFDGTSMYRRANKLSQRNKTADDTLQEEDGGAQSVNTTSLPDIPQTLQADQQMKLLLLEFNIFELCNFTSNDYHHDRNEIISKQLIMCSNGISKLKSRVIGEAKKSLDQYSQDIHEAMKKFKMIHESKMKIIKIINLTDYLSSTINESDIPSGLRTKFLELKQFLLVELKNEDLSSFHPDSNRKNVFMVQLFDYLIQSKIVDNKKKTLLEVFKKFIRNVS